MTKAEYLAELELNSQVLTGTKEITDRLDGDLIADGTRAYTSHMLVKLANGVFSGVTQTFYVVKEGTAEEAVYPTIKENKDYEENEFRIALRTFIDNNYISANMPRVTIDQLNEEQDFAICTAYRMTAEDQIQTSRYFVSRDNNVISFKEFIG